MLSLTKKRTKIAPKGNGIIHSQKKKFTQKLAKDKNHRKIRNHCHFTGNYRGAAHSICKLRFKVPNKIPVVFHNRSNYDYHFIMKELANEFKDKFECLGENTETQKALPVPIEKEIKKNK